jgi:hypothetical protein
MLSPKLIIDEYLLAEQVQDANRPCYFLVDMGEWHVNNAITFVNVELEPSAEVYEKQESSRLTEKRDNVMYESWDIKIKDIKVLYNYHSYKSLLI